MLYRDDALNKRIMTMQHSLDGRSLDIKQKDENIAAQKHGGAPGAPYGGPPGGGPPLSKTKIFVGRLLDDVEPEDLRQYFEQYGTVVDVFMPTVHATGKRKNVGFVEFSSPESCSQVGVYSMMEPACIFMMRFIGSVCSNIVIAECSSSSLSTVTHHPASALHCLHHLRF